MATTKDSFKNHWNLNILIILILCLNLAPGATQLEEFAFDWAPYNPFSPNTIISGFTSSKCHSYLGKDSAELPIYATQVCKSSSSLSYMHSQVDWNTDSSSYQYLEAPSITSGSKILHTSDGLFAIISSSSSSWTLTVKDIPTNTLKYTVSLTKPSGVSQWEFSQTKDYFVIFYQVATLSISEYFYPIAKSTGAPKWSSAVLITPSFGLLSGISIETKMAMDYPGGKFFLAWESSYWGAVSIKTKIIGPSSTDTGVEATIASSLSAFTVHELHDVGMINSKEYVIYSTKEALSADMPIKMWRKDLSSTPVLVNTGWVGIFPSKPYFKASYVTVGSTGSHLLLVYKTVTSSTTKVWFRSFTDSGSGVGSAVVMSTNDIEVDGVVIDGSIVYFMMGPISNTWYIGWRNFF